MITGMEWTGRLNMRLIEHEQRMNMILLTTRVSLSLPYVILVMTVGWIRFAIYQLSSSRGSHLSSLCQCRQVQAVNRQPSVAVRTVHSSTNHLTASLVQQSWAGLRAGPTLYGLQPQWEWKRSRGATWRGVAWPTWRDGLCPHRRADCAEPWWRGSGSPPSNRMQALTLCKVFCLKI